MKKLEELGKSVVTYHMGVTCSGCDHLMMHSWCEFYNSIGRDVGNTMLSTTQIRLYYVFILFIYDRHRYILR